MNRSEMKGLLKGIGIAVIICATIFYSLILNYRAEVASELAMDDSEIIEAARDLGMVFPAELGDEGTEETD